MTVGFKPSYLPLLENGQLYKKVETAKSHLTKCKLCPHECGVNRKKELGICRSTDRAIVSSYGPHLGEETPLVGRRGSGTIFFGYCNMQCVFCQNHDLSFGGAGRIVSNEELAQMMLMIQNRYNCHNINLVTPTHFVASILEAVYIAAEKGLNLPIVYNSGGYERLETLKILEDVVDIYMPDFKYCSTERGLRYSGVKDYPQIAKLAIKEMDRQVGGLKIDKRGIAYRGLLIRHLVLPNGIEDTKEVLKFISQELSPDCLVNLMDQYRPAHRAFEYDELSRSLKWGEYKKAHTFAKDLGLRLADS